MSTLQEQAVQLIGGLSDENVSFLIEIIQKLMHGQYEGESEKIQAFNRLDRARAEMKQYLPDDFDPDKELKEAHAERYGDIG